MLELDQTCFSENSRRVTWRWWNLSSMYCEKLVPAVKYFFAIVLRGSLAVCFTSNSKFVILNFKPHCKFMVLTALNVLLYFHETAKSKNCKIILFIWQYHSRLAMELCTTYSLGLWFTVDPLGALWNKHQMFINPFQAYVPFWSIFQSKVFWCFQGGTEIETFLMFSRGTEMEHWFEMS